MFIANLSVADALASLHTTETGLTSDEAARRISAFGYNRLEEIKRPSVLLTLSKSLPTFLPLFYG